LISVVVGHRRRLIHAAITERQDTAGGLVAEALPAGQDRPDYSAPGTGHSAYGDGSPWHGLVSAAPFATFEPAAVATATVAGWVESGTARMLPVEFVTVPWSRSRISLLAR
jgi:hypothetical protein